MCGVCVILHRSRGARAFVVESFELFLRRPISGRFGSGRSDSQTLDAEKKSDSLKFFGAHGVHFAIGSVHSFAFPEARCWISRSASRCTRSRRTSSSPGSPRSPSRARSSAKEDESPRRGANPSPDESADAESPLPGVELRWRNLTSALRVKGDDAPRLILSEVSGSARPGRFLALLGPSGSGKTSLLNALAAQTPADRNVRLSGAVTANGVAVDGGDAHRRASRMSASRMFFTQSSRVRETLTAAAKMRETSLKTNKNGESSALRAAKP